MIKNYQEIYDISVSMGAEDIDWPGNPSYSRELIAKLANGDICNLSQISLPTHVGTHIDTPNHFVATGKNLDYFPAEKWILPAHVVDIKDPGVIYPAELEKVDIKPGDALLFKTANSTSGRIISGTFTEDYVYISPEAAEFCVKQKVALVGIDYITVDKYGNEEFPTHHILLENEILILEGINLKDVPPGKYDLFCPPLKLKGAEGAPARAVLLR